MDSSTVGGSTFFCFPNYLQISLKMASSIDISARAAQSQAQD